MKQKEDVNVPKGGTARGEEEEEKDNGQAGGRG